MVRSCNNRLELKRLWVSLLSLFFFSLMTPSCSFFGDKEPEEQVIEENSDGESSASVDVEDNTLESNADSPSSEEDSDEEGLAAISSAMGDESDPSLFGENSSQSSDRPFPKYNSSWEVQSHLLSYDQPEEKFLNQCKNEIDQISSTSRNQPSLQMASSQFQSIVRSDVKSYHWCFFHIVKDLDVELERPGLSFDRKMNKFLTTMSQLWIYSTALGRVTNDKKYLKFTKERYVDYSNKYFGRKVETIGTPIAH